MSHYPWVRNKAQIPLCRHRLRWGIGEFETRCAWGGIRNMVQRCSQETYSQENEKKTSKSAPYLRLKNSKRTSKCPVFFYSARKTQKLDRIGLPGRAQKNLNGRLFSLARYFVTRKKRKNLFGSVL